MQKGIELFGSTVFAKSPIINFQLGSKYTPVMEEDIWK